MKDKRNSSNTPSRVHPNVDPKEGDSVRKVKADVDHTAKIVQSIGLRRRRIAQSQILCLGNKANGGYNENRLRKHTITPDLFKRPVISTGKIIRTGSRRI